MSRYKYSTLIVLVLMLCGMAQGTCDSPLSCWIQSLEIIIPSATFGVDDKDGVQVAVVTLTDLVCKDANLGAVTSWTGVDRKSNNPELRLGVSGLGIQCAGHFEAKDTKHPKLLHFSGGAQVVVADSALSAQIMFEVGKDGLASRASLQDCTVDILVPSIHFDGGKFERSFLDWVAKKVTPVVEKEIDKELKGFATTFVGSNVTHILADINQHLEPCLTPPPVPPPPVLPPGNIKWRGNPIVGLIDYVLDSVVGADGPLSINLIVNTLTNGTGAVSVSPAFLAQLGLDIPEIHLELGSAGNMSVSFLGANITGLNTWAKLDLLHPTSDYVLSSSTQTDQLSLAIDLGLNISLPSQGADGVSGTSLYESARLFIDLADSELTFDILLGVKESDVLSLAPSQLVDPGCLTSIFDTVNITYLTLNTTVKHIDVFPLTAPTGLEGELDAAIDAVAAMFLASFEGAFPAFFDCFGAQPAADAFNVAVANLLDSPALICGAPQAEEATFNERRTFQAFMGAVVLSFLIIVLLVLIRNSMASPLSSLSGSGGSGAAEYGSLSNSGGANDVSSSPGLYAVLAAEGDLSGMTSLNGGVEVTSLNGGEKTMSGYGPSSLLLGGGSGTKSSSRGCCAGRASLSVDDSVPWLARYGIPAVLLVNIALFVSANTSVGASVYIDLTVGASTVRLPSLFSFTLANSVHDMWEAGVYPLSLLIAVFSGAWPYVKLLMMLSAWLIPVKPSNDGWREMVLRILDALGKWSLIDSYVLVMMIVAFRLTLAVPAVPTADVAADATAINVVVEAHFGFYGFLLATMLSLAMTHVILKYHRAAALAHDKAHLSGGEVFQGRMIPQDERISLMKTAFLTAGPGGAGGSVSASRKRVTWFLRRGIVVLLAITLANVVSGSVIKAFEFEFRGMTGLVLQFLGDPTVTKYSLLSLGHSLPSAAPHPDAIGIRSIQVTFFLFAFVLPILHLVTMAVLWIVPLSERAQESLFHMSEILNAWSSLDVFVVSVIAALLELRQFAAFIVGDKCNLINQLLRAYFSPALHGDDTCFDVRARLDHGCWTLFAGCVIYIFCAWVISQACHHALAHRRASAHASGARLGAY